MYTQFEIIEDVLIVNFTGDIDHHGTGEIRKYIDEKYSAEGLRDMILDFSDVSFVDSSGIAVVMGRYNIVNDNGGIIVICGCSEYMRTILLMSGIFTIVKECSDVSAGLEYIKSMRGERSNG